MLNSSDEGFFDELKALAKELKATALIECIGGPLTGKLVDQLPSRSTVLFYGALSEKDISEIDPLLLIGRSTTIEAFILFSHLTKIGMSGLISLINRSKPLIQDKTFEMNVAKTFSLSQFEAECADYYANMSAGKYVLNPNMDDIKLVDGATFDEFSIIDLKTE